ncbi:hypothetical protein [Leucothrix arctica]|uniref:Uncharacterized protein n=1 Tax=Leucothrix arctica TaxID=1481894 RepID=A0A317CFR3_9GAMM|nr:hypothetical protein [Leucothrix arctica]PWQ96951.1 hypothetical protein DKT75_07900 [Leucothrix arctica]
MKPTQWIKRRLILHVPLLVCGLLAFITLLLPDSLSPVVLLFLIFAYFFSCFFWRKYLNKYGKLKSADTGLFNLILWGIIGTIGIYMALNPSSPQLVLYETSKPLVYDTIDHLYEAKTPRKSESNRDVTRYETYKHSIEKGAVNGALTKTLNALNDSLFACAFLKQQGLSDSCSGAISTTKRVELDNKPLTVELFIGDLEAESCMETTCRVWLIQTRQAEITRYNDAYIENKAADGVAMSTEATLIDHWQNIVTPIIISNTSTKGWRHITLTDQSGAVSTWKEPKLSAPTP